MLLLVWVFAVFSGNTCIGVGRFRILEGGGGGKVQNIGVGVKHFVGCKLIGAPAPNQCKIIKFLKLGTDNIAKLRIELKSILYEITSNKTKMYIY